MSIKERRTEPQDTLTFISVEDEDELTKETKRAATKDENQERVILCKSRGGGAGSMAKRK